jgi:release factor glutamine methyltransferase
MTGNDLYQRMKTVLAEGGTPTPDLDLQILFEDLAGMDSRLFGLDVSAGQREIPDQIEKSIKNAVARRIAGEPLGRILGYRDFWKHRFYLSPETLEPRPDTETLVESALNAFPVPPRRILDLGTGTGCILLSLLAEWPESHGIGVDLALGACRAAQENSQRLGLQNRASFVCGDWIAGVCGKFDLIVSNPPYIPAKDIPNLSCEVRNHDPILALSGGKDGLEPYKILLPNLKNLLEPTGRAFLEFGIGQDGDIRRLAENSGATLIRIIPDIGGIPRVVEISYGDN